MNIAFLTCANSWHIPVKTKYFVERGHNVFYFGIQPGTGSPVQPEGVTYIDVGSEKGNKYLNMIKNVIKVRQLTREHKIDVLHIIDMSYSIYAPFSLSKKVVIENNGSDVLIRPQEKAVLRFLYPVVYKFADAVVQDSQISQKAGIKYGANPFNNEVIELGIDFRIFNREVARGVMRKRLRIKEDEKVVFSPRGFTELYNIETIIKTIPVVRDKIPDVKYVFCRHFGVEWEAYEELIRKLGVEKNVVFTGFLDNEKELPSMYKDSDVVVSVPSSDSSPRSVYESMACGTPVIVSELEWYHGKFVKDEDIMVVAPKEELYFAYTIINVLEGRASVETEKAFKKVKENIDMVKHMEKLETLYKDLMNEDWRLGDLTNL